MSKEGSILGGVLLIAGSCIGAGMLALPVITGIAGFIPSVLMFVVAWAFMTVTGLLLLEANLRMGHDLSLISIAKKTLGKSGQILCWALFLFLFYSLGVAYVAASGSILHDIILDIFNFSLPAWLGSLLFSLFFGWIIFIGTRPVDYLNRVLMIGLIITYFLLIFAGTQYIQPVYLSLSNWKYSFLAIPILIVSFGFHNMIPSLTHYFKGDARRLRITILLGSLLPLFVYLIWELVILGIVPVEGREGLLHSLDKGQAATHALREIVGNSLVNLFAQSFALFAIVTSFLTQSLSLVDFLADGLKISKVKGNRVFLLGLTLLPPLFCAFIYPGIFISALNFAGGFCAVLLFGIMPSLMVWVLRKKEIKGLKIVPGGKTALILILFFSFGILSLQTVEQLGIKFMRQSSELASEVK